MVRASGTTAGKGEFKLGRYFLVVEECIAVTAKSTGNEGFQVVAKIDGGEADGKEFKYQNFYAPKLFDFAAALLLTDTLSGTPFTAERLNQMRKDLQAKREVADCDFDPDEANGRAFVAEIVMGKPRESDGNRYPEIGFKLWNPCDPEVKDVEKPDWYVKQFAAQLGGGGQGGANSGQQEQKQEKRETVGAGAGNSAANGAKSSRPALD